MIAQVTTPPQGKCCRCTLLNPNNSDKLPPPTKCNKYSLYCLSINVDNLRNKLQGLNTQVYTHNPDVIAVQEILPKNISDIITESIFNIDGYELFTNEKQGWKRGVALYIRKGIGASELNWNNTFEESIWIEIKLRGGDKLIIGCVYCSPNSNSGNNGKFLNHITEVSHLLIAGDYNYPEIDLKNNSSPDDLNNNNTKFLNCSKDSFYINMF